MTSPDRRRGVVDRRRRSAALSLVIASTLVLGGCTLGQASSFTGRAETSCRQTAREVDALPAPTTPVAQLGYALDRYTDMDRVVSEISSDISFPGGDRGQALRRGWLDPARASLRTGRSDLDRLRTAIRSDDTAARQSAFAASSAAGTTGVSTATLRGQGLTSCATLFRAPS